MLQNAFQICFDSIPVFQLNFHSTHICQRIQSHAHTHAHTGSSFNMPHSWWARIWNLWSFAFLIICTLISRSFLLHKAKVLIAFWSKLVWNCAKYMKTVRFLFLLLLTVVYFEDSQLSTPFDNQQKKFHLIYPHDIQFISSALLSQLLSVKFCTLK